LSIASDQQTIVVNFHQDFVASTISDFVRGLMHRGLIYQFGYFCETQFYKEKKLIYFLHRQQYLASNLA
jgi:hypothetical protein